MSGHVTEALSRARDHRSACQAVVDELACVPGLKPSVYLARGERLRCMASRTYLQVLDGFPSGIGLIGQTFASGRERVAMDVAAAPGYLEITPGVRAEVCVPVRADGVTVGVVSVESLEPFDDRVVALVTGLAAALGERLQAIGGGLEETPLQRLLRHAALLQGSVTRQAIEGEVLRAASDIAGMDSAALIGPDGVTAMCGPQTGPLERAPHSALATLRALVAAGTSCYTVGERGGDDFEGLAQLRADGVGSLAALPVIGHDDVLVVADSSLVELSTDTVELLELLCLHTAGALRSADLVADLRRQAATDPLTGLGHHGAFQAALGAAATGDGLAVLMIDVDHFKAVNDTLGHTTGDRLLCALAATLRSVLGPHGEPFRIGGDEFAALVRTPSPADALAFAERIVAAARVDTLATVSAGVGFAGPGDAASAALARADQALYQAKRAGRDTARALREPAEVMPADPWARPRTVTP